MMKKIPKHPLPKTKPPFCTYCEKFVQIGEIHLHGEGKCDNIPTCYGNSGNNSSHNQHAHGYPKKIIMLEQMAQDGCTCTKAQERGSDPSMCLSCAATRALNNIAEFVRKKFDDVAMEEQSDD